MEGTELPLRRHTCSAASQQTSPESPLPRRRATLAAVAQQLGEVEDVALGAEKLGHGWSRAQVVLLVYTLARIVANLCVVPAPVEQLRSQQLGSPGVDERIVRTIDAVARPVVTGLGVYCFLCNKTRFSEKLRLHVWSRRTIFCLACCVADQSVLHVFLQGRSAYKMTVMSCLIWETVCNALQVYMTILKLKALGWGFTARSCEVLLVISFACLAPGCVTVMIFGGSWLTYILMWSSFFTFTLTSLVQSLALCSAATRALLRGGSDEAIRCSAYCLCLNGILAVVGPALSMWSWMSMVRVEFGPLNEDEVFFFAVWVVSIDVGLQVLATLLLSGLIGPKGWDRPMEAFRRLGHLSGFGLASSRIAFPGKINARATQCIVSFPGKYSAQWDNAVANVQQFEDCSLACVFLTDKASGLGRHTDNPDTPGQCWCRMIYGELPAETYLSVVDLKDDSDGVLTKEKLAFKKADADAMGQVLVIKDDQPQMEWEAELSLALNDAEVRCKENRGRAPWGCQWFEGWRINVDAAVRAGQTLHVFYFEGKKGHGKLPWEKLGSAKDRANARKDTGLGASQTAEVAYLEKLGIKYEEHDINEFGNFLLMPHGARAEDA